MRPRGPSCRRPFSPRGRWTQVDPRAPQEALREAFTRWGRPERLRVDNGAPWGSRGDLPTDRVCWRAGLGGAGTDNPPRRPQAHGVQDEEGHEIRRQKATELEAASIRALEVTNRRRGVHAAKPTVGIKA